MNGVNSQRLEVEPKIRVLEEETAAQLTSIRVLEEQWDDYRRVMRDNADVFEQAGVAMGAENSSVKRGMAARRELNAYVAQLSREITEELAEVAQQTRSASDRELERLQREGTGASWD